MPPEKKTALVAAVEILAKRLVSTAELRSKLTAKKLFSPAEIDDAVLAVKRMGALHDDFLAEDVARSYRSRGYGPARIRMVASQWAGPVVMLNCAGRQMSSAPRRAMARKSSGKRTSKQMARPKRPKRVSNTVMSFPGVKVCDS